MKKKKKKKITTRAMQAVAGWLGYELKRRKPRADDGYVLFRFEDSDGKFDYQRYKDVQIAGNKKKLHRVWACRENIEFIADRLRQRIGEPKFGICHGTRRGNEQMYFRDALGCEVIGTEISDTAEQFPHTIQWDFHGIRDEWLERCDFIYSNSFDHSYDPEHCMNQWMRCVRPGGACVLEWGGSHRPDDANELDPFGAELRDLPFLIAKWGKGRFAVRELLQCPKVPSEVDGRPVAIFIHKF
jgi:hypothetical protein